MRLPVSQLLGNSKSLLLLTSSAFSSHFPATTGPVVSSVSGELLFSSPCFYFRQGWDCMRGAGSLWIAWKGKLQSNLTYPSDILQCICPMHCYAKGTLVSFTSFSCNTKCLLFFSLLTYVTGSQKTVGTFQKSGMEQGGSGMRMRKIPCSDLLIIGFYVLRTCQFLFIFPVFQFGLSVLACFSPLVCWRVYFLFLLY